MHELKQYIHNEPAGDKDFFISKHVQNKPKVKYAKMHSHILQDKAYIWLKLTFFFLIKKEINFFSAHLSTGFAAPPTSSIQVKSLTESSFLISTPKIKLNLNRVFKIFKVLLSTIHNVTRKITTHTHRQISIKITVQFKQPPHHSQPSYHICFRPTLQHS